MNDDRITSRSAWELAAGIRAGDLSSAEVVAAFVDRIERLNPQLNAVCHLDAERARQHAIRADRAVGAGVASGPLHGVPILLKDSHRVARMPTMVGNPAAPRRPARTDGTVAARLRDAGAIILGKTNVATDLADFQTDNAVFGRTNNPWDLERTPGGSSGGAAAAVAARLTPFEVGSDIAGSIRVPAHFTGIWGLKPTAGSIPVRGHVTEPVRHPRGGGLNALATIGPLARDPRDLELLFKVLKPGAEAPPATRPVVTLRLLPSLPGLPVTSAIHDAVLAAGEAATAIGLRPELIDDPPPSDAHHRVYMRAYEAARRLGSRWSTSAALAEAQAAVRADWDRLLERHDAIILPVAMCAAFTHRPSGTPIEVDGAEMPYWRLTRYCEPFNLTGHPALAMPFAMDAEGMPIGIQLVGQHGQDQRLIELAAAISSERTVLGPALPRMVPACG
jgi:amidase